MTKQAPYGVWETPITAEWVTLSQKRYGTIVVDQNVIYWDELRPSEGGRTVIMRWRDGQLEEVSPETATVRSRVHEYGGAPFAVWREQIYYVNDKDQRIYHGTTPLTEAGTRYADLQVQGDHLLAVGEKGHDNFLVSLHLPTKKETIIAEGHDFYASPTWSRDGSQIAFLTWDHPNMPWDGTELWLADFKEGTLHNIRRIAGGKTESIFQPQWSPQAVLHFVSDRTGWWNLYRLDNDRITPVNPQEAECGLPQWSFGMSTYAFCGNSLVTTSVKNGIWTLYKEGKPLDLPWSYYTQIRATSDAVVCIAGSPTEEKLIVKLDKKSHIITHNLNPKIGHDYISIPQPIEFPSGKGRTAHGFYYPPHNPDFEPPPNTLPPLLVMTHGGPTGATSSVLDFKIQYWTSRGFAVLDVDYTGSTGYGRSYRDALKGQWGVFDVEDCEAGARYLIEQQKADPRKIAIRGGSAGGYTTLAALTFGTTFTVGASYYGISDLIALAQETHKFELHYLDTLIGPYPAAKEIYLNRSPLYSIEKLHSPIIFFQGSEDRVVPLNQAQAMYDGLKQRNIPTELVIYEGEQHGFRHSENIRSSLEKELAFYLKSW